MKTVQAKDLIFVVLYGVVLPFLLGILLGLADYFVIDRWDITLAYLFFWVSAAFVGRAVRKQYVVPHPLYSVITGLGMVFFGTVLLSVPTLWSYFAAGSGALVLFDLRYYVVFLITLLNPAYWIAHFSLGLLLNLLTLAVGTIIGVKRTL